MFIMLFKTNLKKRNTKRSNFTTCGKSLRIVKKSTRCREIKKTCLKNSFKGSSEYLLGKKVTFQEIFPTCGYSTIKYCIRSAIN